MSAIEHILKMNDQHAGFYVHIIEITLFNKEILFDFINKNVLNICYTKSI